MEYNFKEIESKWQKIWAEKKTFKVEKNTEKPKYYVLDMFPYPSGAGLHVGHPLGYIASDIYSRYKRLQGFNVLHPMGYDSFGLPAEQYAIQTGQHPEITTKTNINRYREQLDQIGFSFDWDREIKTSDSTYYKWTQWIFKQLYNTWYNKHTNKAEQISHLVELFEKGGNKNIKAETSQKTVFTKKEWNDYSEKQKHHILMNYRLTFLDDSWVNWCPKLGSVLANDEIKDGLSERGGFPVEQKLMRQWSMRITAYAERLLKGLDRLDWTNSIKEQQKNWIGKSVGASVFFNIENSKEKIEVFTTRPDTIFGVSFMVLAPEHPLVKKITPSKYKKKIDCYVKQSSLKLERDRQSDVKNISGEFTGSYAIHPFSDEKIPIWIGDYVLASYGTGAVMSVPCGDQRDYDFAKHFGIEIKNIFKNKDISKCAYTEKDCIITNSQFLNNLTPKEAMVLAIKEIEKKEFGKGKTNYRLRDVVFSRQRYWGEPFPVFYKDNLPYMIKDEKLPIELPEIDKYEPTEDGEPPLARAKKEDWKQFEGDRMEYNTMPGWAGSSWYFLRYLDPTNEREFVAKEKVDYWKNVDLYIGGSEHATGHLLYSRFWTKFLYDLGHIPFDEPFQKMINQGMILGKSSFVYRIKDGNQFVSYNKRKEYNTNKINVDINFVEGNKLDIDAFRSWRKEFQDATFIFEDDGTYLCGSEVEKMSKSKFNVQNPDELVLKYGADTLRCYEMFLGPLEQSKPWDTKGISGVSNFLRKFWRLFHSESGKFEVSEEKPSDKAMKTIHKTIKKVQDDLNRFSFNTSISNFMIAVNELTEQKCNNKEVLEKLTILMSPYTPHICEEIWEKLGNDKGSISFATFPAFDENYLVENSFEYPVSFNGKMRFKIKLPSTFSKEDVKKEVLSSEKAKKYIEGKEITKVIVVPKRIVNIVIKG